MSDVLAPPIAPERKIRRTPWRTASFVALDFEATGLGRGDTIISFGTVPVRGSRIEVGEARYQLVHPGDVEVSRRSIAVHMLRPVDLIDAPPADAAKAALSQILRAQMILAWWAPVEAAFLDQLFGGGRRSWMARAIDVRDLLLALEGPQAGVHTLSAAAERYGVPVASAHHALDDALVTAQLFLVLASKLGRRARSIRDLQKLAPRQGSARFR